MRPKSIFRGWPASDPDNGSANLGSGAESRSQQGNVQNAVNFFHRAIYGSWAGEYSSQSDAGAD